MADIFLSYAREDLDRAVAGALETEGWSVFWDRRIPPGQVFEEYIGERILECRAVVVLWSPASVESQWVRIEAGHGRDRRILVPAFVATVDVPFGYQHLHAANLVSWSPGVASADFRGLVSSIEQLVPRESTPPTRDQRAGRRPLPAVSRSPRDRAERGGADR